MFLSEFCMVDYVEQNHAILLTWKKFCCGSNYREPVDYARQLCGEKGADVFIIDARNGFEDEKEDVEWGFNVYLPQLAETNCRDVIFIMNEVNDIEGEMDMWSREFGKYFTVSRVTSYQSAVELIGKKKKALAMAVTYTVKPGLRDEFYQAVLKTGVIAGSRLEPGNLRYDYYLPMEQDDQLLLLENWVNQEEQEKHLLTPHFQKLQAVKAEFVMDVQIERYYYIK